MRPAGHARLSAVRVSRRPAPKMAVGEEMADGSQESSRRLSPDCRLWATFWRGSAPPPPPSPAPRVRPGDPGWPSDDAWQELGRGLDGELIKVSSPLSACVGAPADACAQVFKELKNPYYLGDEVGLTQSLGWVGAWTSRPSVYAVAAQSTADVVAAVNFARTHNLRLVVKGGGHSYQGSSNAADSLLDLDPPHARHHPARRLRRRGLRGAG